MARPKSAAGIGTRSFLDDLLGNNFHDDELSRPSTSSNRQRKSVRFFDESNDNKKQNETKNTETIRSTHSSVLGSLLDTKSIGQSTGNLNQRSKSDWLGLGDDNDISATIIKSSNEPFQVGKQIDASTIKTKSIGGTGAGTSANDESDWIAAGLKARQTMETARIGLKPEYEYESNIDNPILNVGARSVGHSNVGWKPKLLDESTKSSSSAKRFGHRDPSSINIGGETKPIHSDFDNLLIEQTINHRTDPTGQQHQQIVIQNQQNQQQQINENNNSLAINIEEKMRPENNNINDKNSNLFVFDGETGSSQSNAVLETKVCTCFLY